MRLLMCAFMCLSAVSLMKTEARAERKALLIANTKYQRYEPLRTPARDAREVAKMLKGVGYKVTVKRDVKVDQFQDVVADYMETVTEEDEVYFHYAGHGIEIGGEALLLGVDFKARTEKRALKKGFPVDEAVELMGRARAAVVVIDACRINPYARKIFRGSRRGSTRGMMSSSAKVDSPKRGGVYLVFSTTKGDVAEEGDDVSPFVSSFRAALSRFGHEPLGVFFGSRVQPLLKKERQELEMRLLGELPADFRLKAADGNCPAACRPECNEQCVKAIQIAKIQVEAAKMQSEAKARAQAEELARLKRERDAAYARADQAEAQVLSAAEIKARRAAEAEAKRAAEAQARREAERTLAASRAEVKLTPPRVLMPSERPPKPTVNAPCGENCPKMEWVWVPGGVFMMGSNDGNSNEKPVHQVSVSGFWMAESEVTKAQYAACVEAGACSEPDSAGKDGGETRCIWSEWFRDDHPINCVDWGQARDFSRWVGGDLPTEAQWEYAARGGENFKYAGSNDASAVGWHGEDLDTGSTHEVKKKRANRYGLYDMSGNVCEWTLDEWHDSYEGAPKSGDRPWGKTLPRCMQRCDIGSSRRVVMGGGWLDDAWGLRVASRGGNAPFSRFTGLGFRPAGPAR